MTVTADKVIVELEARLTPTSKPDPKPEKPKKA